MKPALAPTEEEKVMLFLAHELKGPVATIVVGIHRLRSALSSSPSVRREAFEVLDIVEASSRTLVPTIDQLIGLGDVGEPFDPEPIQAHRLAASVLKRFRTEHPLRVIHDELPSSLPTALGNPFFVETVLHNLLINADQHSPPAEPIDVTTGVWGKEIYFSVRDRGVGVEKGELGRIFDLFYRSERTRRRSSRGRGIGLFLCKTLVERMDGRIWAESAPGGGLAVSFTLPISDVLRTNGDASMV